MDKARFIGEMAEAITAASHDNRLPRLCRQKFDAAAVALRDAVAMIAELEAEVARLGSIVAKLPVTRDGVPIVPGMTIWVREDMLDENGNYGPRIGEHTVAAVYRLKVVYTEEDAYGYMGARCTGCYSTREAAEEAHE